MLNDFIYIRSRLEEEAVTNPEITGFMTVSSEDILKIKSLSEKGCIDDFVLVQGKNKHVNEIKDNDHIKLNLYTNKLKDEKYYETLDDLIKSSSQSAPENRYYIHSLKYDSSLNQQTPEIASYESVIKTINFLTTISDFNKDNTLVFIQSKQIVLTTEYSLTDLSKSINIQDLINHIEKASDKEERKKIFTYQLILFLHKVPEENYRFRFLLKNFNDLYINYIKSHDLYLEKYSYEKVKSEIDKEILEYSKKIQSVINDAQTKLVAIPVAFLLIIGQFDLTGEKLYFNIALVLSAFVFSILIEVLLQNQFSLLDFISADVERFKESISQEKSKIIGDDLTTTFTKVTKLHKKQKSSLNTIRLLVWLTPVFSIGLMVLSLTNNTISCVFKILIERYIL
jgi:hypothetical protein